VQKGCSADPHSFPLREEEDDREVAHRRRHGASRRVEDTPQKCDRQSSPEPMNVREASTLPHTLRVSEETGGEGTPVTEVEVLAHL
jgi:hypothetical protein